MIGKPTDGPISRYINRKLSAPISRFIVSRRWDVDPNIVTIMTTVFGIIAGALYVVAYPWIAGIMVQLASVLDGVDGEIARITNKQSKFGGFFDSLLDRFVDIAILIGLSVSALVISEGPNEVKVIFFLSMIALSGSLLVSFMNARSEASLGTHPSKVGGVPLATRDIRLFIVFIGSIMSAFYVEALIWTLIVVGVMTYTHVLLNLGILSKRFWIRKENRALIHKESARNIGVAELEEVCGGSSGRATKEILGDDR